MNFYLKFEKQIMYKIKAIFLYLKAKKKVKIKSGSYLKRKPKNSKFSINEKFKLNQLNETGTKTGCLTRINLLNVLTDSIF